MHRKNILLSLLVLLLAIINCNAPSANNADAIEAIAATQTSLALTLEAGGAPPQQSIINNTETPTTTSSPQPSATQCSGTVTANSDVNVRTGPGTVYPSVGFVPLGGNVPLAGKSADGTWWYVQFPAGPGGYGWMAGSVTTATCVPATLAVIAAPPTPTPPPTATETVTPTFSLLLPLLPIDPGLFALGDIKIQDVFLLTTGEIAARVAVIPSNSLSGNVTYKVWVDGALKVTDTRPLPAGSILYSTGETIAGSHTVKVKVDTPNDYVETNEGNNVMEVVLSH